MLFVAFQFLFQLLVDRRNLVFRAVEVVDLQLFLRQLIVEFLHGVFELGASDFDFSHLCGVAGLVKFLVQGIELVVLALDCGPHACQLIVAHSKFVLELFQFLAACRWGIFQR